MSSIPPDIYEQVHEMALAIVNASAEGDEAMREFHFQALRAYFDDQTANGRSHPFLTEAVADFTDDNAEAVRLYQLALHQSSDHPDEPTHTKMICLAKRLIERDEREQAEAFLRDGHAEAILREDTDWIEEADELLSDLGAHPHG